MNLDDRLIDAGAHHFTLDGDLALVDVDVLLLERIRDILARHAAEELAAVADADRDLDLDLLELLGHEFGLVSCHGLLTGLGACLGIGYIEVLRRGRHCCLARQQEVAAVALRYLYDIAFLAEFLNVLL